MSSLRDQIFGALHATFPGDYHEDHHGECRPCDERTKAVMPIVGPALAAKDAEIERLRAEAERLTERWQSTQLHAHELIDRSERTEDERDRLRALVVRITGATLAMQTYGRTSGNVTLVGFAQRLREMLPDIQPDGTTTWPSMAYPVCANCGAPTTAQNALCQPCRRDAAPDQPATEDK